MNNRFVCFVFPAIAVEFDQIGYEAVEGQNISVCVVLMGETDSPVEVSLSSLQDTATGSSPQYVHLRLFTSHWIIHRK